MEFKDIIKNKYTVKVMRAFAKFIWAEKMETINLVSLVMPDLDVWMEIR